MSEKLNTIQPIDTEYLPVTRANVNHLAVLLQQAQDEVAQLRAELEQMKKELDLARRQLYFFRGAFPKAARNWDKAVIK